MRTVNALKFSELYLDTIFLLLFLYLIINILLLEAFNSQLKSSFKKSNEPEPSWGTVTSVPSVTNVYYMFMNCRDAGRFVRCGFVYVIVCYGAANGQCCRPPLSSRIVSAYGTAHFVPVSFTCCQAP